MALQTVQISVPRTALSADDFGLDAEGNLKIDKDRLNKIIKDNINKIVPASEGVSVSVSVGT
jgi:hypothetical protein